MVSIGGNRVGSGEYDDWGDLGDLGVLIFLGPDLYS
jgi:hypothetical protein